MRYTILFIICIASHLSMRASGNPTDSLLHLLPQKKLPQEKYETLRSLADLSFETPIEKTYLKLCYLEAEKADKRPEMLEALGDLAYTYIKGEQSDSARFYMDIIRQAGNDDEVKSRITQLSIRLSDIEMKPADIEAARKELESKSQKEKSIYAKIEYAAFIGNRLYRQEKFKEALPYLQTATELATTLPFKEGFKILVQLMRLQSKAYTGDNQFDKSAALLEESIRLRTNHYEQYYRQERPFYYINSYYIESYTSLFTNIKVLSQQKINDYLRKIIILCKQSTAPTDKYCCFLALNNYYLDKEDFAQGLSTCDSLIKYAELIAPYNLAGLYDVSSQINQAMGNYKEALYDLKASHSLADSISNVETSNQLNQLQVQYKVDKLNYEKSQLEIKSKRILLIALSVILLIVVVVCTYLYRSLKKERRMKARLRLLKTKAEESENMKTAFINSICHEIRTPLNAIVGFTDLIFNEDIDEESRRDFPAEVQRNTSLLTSLISGMLEVSNLDVSHEKLPCEPTNITAVCQHETDILRHSLKPAIRYLLDIPASPAIVSCNERYLGLVIENLLNNANKFTDSGDITLHYHIDQLQKRLIISITDTGCGIPANKYEEVFERFTKLDSYKQGSGLGLYLCRLIIKRLTGEIGIDPDYTQGTRILISLPMDE